MIKADFQAIFHKEQKLIAIQAGIFIFFVAILVVVGALVYHKTSIHDRQEAIEQKRSIEGGFMDLRKSVEGE